MVFFHEILQTSTSNKTSHLTTAEKCFKPTEHLFVSTCLHQPVLKTLIQKCMQPSLEVGLGKMYRHKQVHLITKILYPSKLTSKKK